MSISHFWSIYGQMSLSPRFSYLGEGSISLMNLTSKQGFAQSTDGEIFESDIHSRIAEKDGHIAKSYMQTEYSLWPKSRILLQVLFFKKRSCFLVCWNSLGADTNTEPSSLNPKISIWSHFSISLWSHGMIDAFLNCISLSKQRE